MSGAAAPTAGAAESPRRRTLRVGILGCGTVLLGILVLGSIAGYFVARHPREFRTALGALFESLEDEIAANFSSRVTPGQREEFRAARERFHDAWKAGRIDMTTADALRRRLMKESRKERLEPPDVQDLTRFLNRLAGGSAAPPAVRASG